MACWCGQSSFKRQIGWVRSPPGPPICLRFSLVGVSACQADVGGIVTRLGRHYCACRWTGTGFPKSGDGGSNPPMRASSTECSLVRLKCRAWNAEIGGSNPLTLIYGRLAQWQSAWFTPRMSEVRSHRSATNYGALLPAGRPVLQTGVDRLDTDTRHQYPCRWYSGSWSTKPGCGSSILLRGAISARVATTC